ncbi:MAG: glycosyltransferase 87 family protein, partial [Anaerolineae bacterium]
MKAQFQNIWQRSHFFRIVLVLSVIYTVVRLGVQGAYLAMLLMPESGILGGVPDWAGSEEPMVPADLQIYIDAAERLSLREDLYVRSNTPDPIEIYQYPPSFAVAFTPLLLFPPAGVAIIQTILHIVAYVGLYIVWFRLFLQGGFEKCQRLMIWALPVWLLFSSFWTDLGYLNVYIIVALLGTLLINAVIEENLGMAIMWLALIVQVKPHWAFALI